MADSRITVPEPVNEPVRSYAPGTAERASIKSRLDALLGDSMEIPLRIGGRPVTTGNLGDCRPPHDHQRLLGRFHKATAAQVGQAIDAARNAHADWSRMPRESRAAIFLKAAEMLATTHRDTLNGATMLGQSKNVCQAEIDSACELIDFWRFNTFYQQQLYGEQPGSQPGMWNYVDHRPLEGFVFAVTPFNFTAIAGNLPTAPALMGNTVIWKPASSSVYSSYFIMELLEEAGLPPGVINFVPGSGAEVGDPALDSPDLAGIHFTGSTRTFQSMWSRVGANIENYRSYPRIVGETGGKNFVFVHPSASCDDLATALVRGAFEYQGQKCSAASRAFVPSSMWDQVLQRLEATIATIDMGTPLDFRNFMCAVIDKAAFDSITAYIDFARDSNDHEIVIGGKYDGSEGYFIEPTIVVAEKPDARLMCEEIFGPVLTLCRYQDRKLEEAIRACDEASSYALTGAIFCRDREAIVSLSNALRFAAGNFYINDKPTGAVVGQQPFGGGRASGTNDKAGSVLNLLRWVSPRSIKETFVPPVDYRYPHMAEE